jgi:hypothetical protein
MRGLTPTPKTTSRLRRFSVRAVGYPLPSHVVGLGCLVWKGLMAQRRKSPAFANVGHPPRFVTKIPTQAAEPRPLEWGTRHGRCGSEKTPHPRLRPFVAIRCAGSRPRLKPPFGKLRAGFAAPPLFSTSRGLSSTVPRCGTVIFSVGGVNGCGEKPHPAKGRRDGPPAAGTSRDS